MGRMRDNMAIIVFFFFFFTKTDTRQVQENF